MPSFYCPSCGGKHNAMTKPRNCEVCNSSFEPKRVAKPRQPRYEEAEELPEEVENDFDREAVRQSIRLQPEEHDNQFMTVEQLRKGGVSAARGGAPVEAGIRDEVLGSLMGNRPAANAPTPPGEDRKVARRVGKLTRR